jgi:hypothetical protein
VILDIVTILPIIYYLYKLYVKDLPFDPDPPARHPQPSKPNEYKEELRPLFMTDSQAALLEAEEAQESNG